MKTSPLLCFVNEQYTETKINLKRPFIAAGGKGTTMEKPKNDQLAAEKLADPEDRSCVYKLENNLKWMKKLKPGKARSHCKIFRQNLYVLSWMGGSF